MASKDNCALSENDDVDFLNSTVDEFFSFIYDESGSDDDLSVIQNEDNLEKVVDDHFSFLLDQDVAGDEPLYNNIPLEIDREIASVAYSQNEEEPLYSNIEEVTKTSGEDKNLPCGTPVSSPIDDSTAINGNQIASTPPQILDIYVPGESFPDTVGNADVINIPVLSETTDPIQQTTDTNRPQTERKSSVYLNGDQDDFPINNITPISFTILTDIDSPSIYTLKAPTDGGNTSENNNPEISKDLGDKQQSGVENYSDVFEMEDDYKKENNCTYIPELPSVDNLGDNEHSAIIDEIKSSPKVEHKFDNASATTSDRNTDKSAFLRPDSKFSKIVDTSERNQVETPSVLDDIQKETPSLNAPNASGDTGISVTHYLASVACNILEHGFSVQPPASDQSDIESFVSKYPENPSESNGAASSASEAKMKSDLDRLHQLDMELMQLEEPSHSPSRYDLCNEEKDFDKDPQTSQNPKQGGSQTSNISENINQVPQTLQTTENIPTTSLQITENVPQVRPQTSEISEDAQTDTPISIEDPQTSDADPRTPESICNLVLDDLVEAVNPSVFPQSTLTLPLRNEILVRDSEAPLPERSSPELPRSSNSRSIGRVLRRSLRRLKENRLSGRRSKKSASNHNSKDRSSVSEETVVRRQPPSDPEIGLPSVRSPRASAVLLPTLLAALNPTEPPREVFPMPGQSTRNNRQDQNDVAQTSASNQTSPAQQTPPVFTSSSQPGTPRGPWPLLNLSTFSTTTVTSCSTTGPVTSTPVSTCTRQTPGTPGANFGTEPGTWYTPITCSASDRVLAPNWRIPGSSDSLPSTAEQQPRNVNTRSTTSRNNDGARLVSPERRQHRGGHSHHHTRHQNRSRQGHSRSSSSATQQGLSTRSSSSSFTSDTNNNSSNVVTSPDTEQAANDTWRPNVTGSVGTPASRQLSSSSQTSDRTTDSQLQERSRDSLDLSRTRNLSRTRSQSSRGFVPPKRGVWPHGFSGLFASLSVTVTMFNLSRFAVLGAHFGWQFPIQWLVVSLVVGLPLLSFHAALGQYIGGSVVDMWVISPIFQGVGYGLLLAQTILGIYCCVPVAWLFTYFRDSFDLRRFKCIEALGCNSPQNLTAEINHYVPNFFTSTVLQRYDDGFLDLQGEDSSESAILDPSSPFSTPYQPSPTPGSPSILNSLGSIKFDLSFNIALIWVITFLALSRGARSYGKVCYLIFLLPCVCYLAVCGNLIYWVTREIDITKFKAHFLDRHSWMAASREAFLVWGLHGAVIQQIAANNRRRHRLWRDTTILSLVTVSLLGLAAFCGLLCGGYLEQKGLVYRHSSFESSSSRAFVSLRPDLQEDSENDDPPDYFRGVSLQPHPMGPLVHDASSTASSSIFAFDNFYVGIKIRNRYSTYFKRTRGMRTRKADVRSGYNTIRFLIELFPAMVFTKENALIALWPPLFYMAFLLFGLAQQLSVWHTVVQGVIRINYDRLHEWETSLTFSCCIIGFSAALPMATGVGIDIVFFLDYLIGCAWWIMILQLIQIFAVLFVRGKPCSAQEMARRLLDKCKCCCSSLNWLAAPVSLAWTILVPVGLLVLSISSFQTGNYREIFAWDSDYWPRWACQLASGLQLLPLFLVPFVGLIQTCRYLSDPRQELFQRIQHLYRPPQHNELEDDDETFLTQRSDGDLEALQLPYTGSNPPPSQQTPSLDTEIDSRPYSDPPPKYTPPPSYSTATGSSLFKLLNRSARGMRYLQNTLRQAASASPPQREPPSSTPTDASSTRSDTRPYIPPPDYLPSSSRLLRNETPSNSSSSGQQPPQYATLDPIRRRPQGHNSIIPPLFPPGKDILQDNVLPRGFSPSRRPSRGSFSRRSSLRGSDFRRSLRNSLRRSAHRFAVTFSPGGFLSGGSNIAPERASSNLELTSHSDA